MIGPVSCRADRLSKRYAMLGDAFVSIVRVIACLFRMQTGQKADPSRHTDPFVIELGKSKALLRKQVKVGRLYLTAITANIREPHIICHDEDNIGRRAR